MTKSTYKKTFESLPELDGIPSAICMRVTVGADPDAIAETLYNLPASCGVPHPTLMVASVLGLSALWIFDAPLPEARLVALAQALAKAAYTSDLHGWTLTTAKLSAGELINEHALRTTLQEFLPENTREETR